MKYINVVIAYFNDTSGDDLSAAIKNDDFNKVKDLLNKGVSPDATDSLGRPALFTAVLHENIDIAEYLLQKGANANCVNYLYKSVLSQAVQMDSLEISYDLAELLLSYGADPNDTDSGKPLHIHAYINQKDEVAKLLIKHGAYINAEDNSGNTLLSYAIAENDVEMVDFALKNGACTDNIYVNGSKIKDLQTIEKDIAELIEYYSKNKYKNHSSVVNAENNLDSHDNSFNNDKYFENTKEHIEWYATT
ncbi:MAG: ankyrin repeat domain-containing protein [Sphingobacteriia bacterium]|nr:ankyrin repeat domain-containing protein [Sphingobacteriia bacterium]